MPTYTFTDAEPKSYELWPAGDYQGRVVACEFLIQQKGKTTGSDVMALDIAVQRAKGDAVEEKEITERLIFHATTAWKVDAFAKAFNLLIDGKPPTKGQPIEWTEHRVIGLQGWVNLGVEEYLGKDGTPKKINRVQAFLFNKPKLPKITPPVEIPDGAEMFD